MTGIIVLVVVAVAVGVFIGWARKEAFKDTHSGHGGNLAGRTRYGTSRIRAGKGRRK